MAEPKQIILTDWQTSRTALQAIRCKDFILEQKNIPEADEFDAADEHSTHVFVMSEKRDAVGTGRFEATGKIAKLAVVAEYRDRCAGTAILRRPVKEAGIRGYHHVYLHVQSQALDFDGKFGFSQ